MWPIIGALAAIAIGMMAMRPYEQDTATQMQNVHASATASDWALIDNAATAYITANYAAVEANSTATTPAVITVPMLEATGELPASFSALNPFGQTWVVQVLQPTPGTLQTMVLSTGGTAIPEKLAPLIANLVGQEGGIVPYNGQAGTLNSSKAVGSYGGWSIPLTGYTNPGPGHLASLLAFNNGNLQNDYLYRNAVPGQPQLNEMQTALNMGNQNITAADNVSAQSAQLASGDPNGMPGSLQIGSNYYYGDNTNAAVRTPGGLYIQNQTGSGPAPINEVSTINATGNIASNNGQADLYNDPGYGTYLQLNGSNGNSSYAMDNNGYFNVVVNNNSTLGLSIAPTGNTTVGGTLNTGWGGAVGAGCGTWGAMGLNTNGTGALVACVNGAWQPMGGGGFTNTYQMGVGNGAWYYNSTGSAEFVSSFCQSTPYSSGYVENVTMYALAPSGGIAAESRGQVQEGGSDANFSAAPSASIMIPPGYYLDVNGTNMSCSVAVAY